MAKVPVLHYWYSALSADVGIELICSDPDAVKQRLYKARAEAQDSDLDAVSICASPFDPMRIFLVKRPQNEKA